MHQYLSPEEVKTELLNLLVSFDDFCTVHDLRYSLDSGTLLGAIRHKGFIPWDDDIDISMPRPDYEKMRGLRKELPRHLTLIDCRDEECPTAYPKICLNTIRAQEPSLVGCFDEMLWIDIFPMDGVEGDCTSLGKIKDVYRRAVRSYRWTQTKHIDDNLIKRMVKRVATLLIDEDRARKEISRLSQAIIDDPGYENSEWVSSLIAPDKAAWRLPRDQYENMVAVEFEGRHFPAMSCWHEFLTTLYGDYMQLPPEDQRQTHHLKAWRV